MKVTERTIEALKIIKENPGIRATEFGDKFWPDSEHKKSVSNQGNGACRGKKVWLMAGSYVGKLKKQGLVTHFFSDPAGYNITSKGREILNNQQ